MARLAFWVSSFLVLSLSPRPCQHQTRPTAATIAIVTGSPPALVLLLPCTPACEWHGSAGSVHCSVEVPPVSSGSVDSLETPLYPYIREEHGRGLSLPVLHLWLLSRNSSSARSTSSMISAPVHSGSSIYLISSSIANSSLHAS
ncbi:hypothetical protein QBC45DRAFT_435264 [Copromyces sp. CBS 386.78]|nr:hypothetical protein QBC45DRAFT_435264 [Copromyces sp. CBS 386.78]